MLPQTAALLLGLEEVLATIGTATIATDSLLFLNALRIGRFLPASIKASSKLRSNWIVATRIAKTTEDIMSSRVYSDVRFMVHEMSVMIDELKQAQMQYDAGVGAINKAVEDLAEAAASPNYNLREAREMPVRVELTSRDQKDKEVVTLGTALDAANNATILKRLLATYVGKRLISSLTGNLLSRIESLSLLEARVSRFLVSHLFTNDLAKSAATKFDNLAKDWAGEMYPGAKIQASTARAMMFKEFGFFPSKYRGVKTPLSTVELTESDYQRFAYLVWRNAFSTYHKAAQIIALHEQSSLHRPADFMVWQPQAFR